ncbi:hypothetical protein ACQP2Y_24615 [Actinoplanes sp. CA-051413]|uniref:hypothetical protein n=1 Tax=Actinoplanes sp. CA-051413 TaxID=3239899 RepID=UPI003D98CED2
MELLKPDDVLENFLKYLFGSSSVIVTGFLIVKFLLDWWAFGTSTVRRTRQGFRATTRAYTRLRRIGPVQVLVATVVSVAVLAIQVVWLASSYVVGNGVALFVLNRPMDDGPHWAEFIASLRWDVVSTTYVVLAALALVIQYRRGGSVDDGNPARMLIMMPLTFIGGITAFAALLSGLMWALLTWKPDPNIDLTPAWTAQFGLQTGSIAGIALVYALSTAVIMRTPEMMKRAWQKPPEDPDVTPVLLGWEQDGWQPDRWQPDRSRRRGGAGS